MAKVTVEGHDDGFRVTCTVRTSVMSWVGLGLVVGFIGRLTGDEIYASRLVSVNTNSIPLSLVLFVSRLQYPVSFPLLSLSSSL
ncbi:hypothetical protein VNO80_05884 [Phaseolus coccineus]|uniref:Uncharacterized protein n=1 Tax=Phaseolus coccineus TaxID=3886 RepID=A0AAN9NMV3_PHACN